MDNSDMTNDVGTERYMASEVKNNNSYDYKIDIYSCGILLYELFENKKFSLEHKNKWYYTPKKIKDLIKNYMINENPEDRYSAISLIKVLDKIL
jgi:serine/threonine protein kinase